MEVWFDGILNLKLQKPGCHKKNIMKMKVLLTGVIPKKLSIFEIFAT